MAPSLLFRVAARLRTIGVATVLLVLVTAPFERWYLTRRSNELRDRILNVRRMAIVRHPEGWQADSVAVAEVADLEYHRAQTQRRLLSQWTLNSGTLWLLIAGSVLIVGGWMGSRRHGARSREGGSGT